MTDDEIHQWLVARDARDALRVPCTRCGHWYWDHDDGDELPCLRCVSDADCPGYLGGPWQTTANPEVDGDW